MPKELPVSVEIKFIRKKCISGDLLFETEKIEVSADLRIEGLGSGNTWCAV